jgi:hypothetical protein
MSFNRLSYDLCAYSKTIQQSTDPLEYNLYKGKFESCISCPTPDITNNLDFGIRSDVESDLKGQVRVGTKCDEKKYPTNAVPPASAYVNPIVCQGIYKITPTNIPTQISNGLKDLSNYGQNVCPI